MAGTDDIVPRRVNPYQDLCVFDNKKIFGNFFVNAKTHFL